MPAYEGYGHEYEASALNALGVSFEDGLDKVYNDDDGSLEYGDADARALRVVAEEEVEEESAEYTFAGAFTALVDAMSEAAPADKAPYATELAKVLTQLPSEEEGSIVRAAAESRAVLYLVAASRNSPTDMPLAMSAMCCLVNLADMGAQAQILAEGGLSLMLGSVDHVDKHTQSFALAGLMNMTHGGSEAVREVLRREHVEQVLERLMEADDESVRQYAGSTLHNLAHFERVEAAPASAPAERPEASAEAEARAELVKALVQERLESEQLTFWAITTCQRHAHAWLERRRSARAQSRAAQLLIAATPAPPPPSMVPLTGVPPTDAQLAPHRGGGARGAQRESERAPGASQRSTADAMREMMEMLAFDSVPQPGDGAEDEWAQSGEEEEGADDDETIGEMERLARNSAAARELAEAEATASDAEAAAAAQAEREGLAHMLAELEERRIRAEEQAAAEDAAVAAVAAAEAEAMRAKADAAGVSSGQPVAPADLIGVRAADMAVASSAAADKAAKKEKAAARFRADVAAERAADVADGALDDVEKGEGARADWTASALDFVHAEAHAPADLPPVHTANRNFALEHAEAAARAEARRTRARVRDEAAARVQARARGMAARAERRRRASAADGADAARRPPLPRLASADSICSAGGDEAALEELKQLLLGVDAGESEPSRREHAPDGAWGAARATDANAPPSPPRTSGTPPFGGVGGGSRRGSAAAPQSATSTHAERLRDAREAAAAARAASIAADAPRLRSPPSRRVRTGETREAAPLRLQPLRARPASADRVRLRRSPSAQRLPTRRPDSAVPGGARAGRVERVESLTNVPPTIARLGDARGLTQLARAAWGGTPRSTGAADSAERSPSGSPGEAGAQGVDVLERALEQLIDAREELLRELHEIAREASSARDTFSSRVLDANALYVELTHASVAVIDLLRKWARAVDEQVVRSEGRSDDGVWRTAVREEDYERDGHSYLDRMAVDTLFLAAQRALPPPQHACTTRLCSALELTLLQRGARGPPAPTQRQEELHREVRRQTARMEAAHALLEARPARLGRADRPRGLATSSHGPPSPRAARVTRVHRVLGPAWCNGHACVRASLVDGSIHIVPVEQIEPKVLLAWRGRAAA
ncbi:hypothetical protein KFE25_009414 [Diacronema lutheri]|uniref:Uncharacterized protein n=1 Tax=Diacronema lutheri TaxID=2081491 RepID=A0A8J6CKE5_DIALT|nr:hypothetical protein KFE25_009414 [Diacronema lutheri]